jgi:hypothetical protein
MAGVSDGWFGQIQLKGYHSASSSNCLASLHAGLYS